MLVEVKILNSPIVICQRLIPSYELIFVLLNTNNELLLNLNVTSSEDSLLTLAMVLTI